MSSCIFDLFFCNASTSWIFEYGILNRRAVWIWILWSHKVADAFKNSSEFWESCNSLRSEESCESGISEDDWVFGSGSSGDGGLKNSRKESGWAFGIEIDDWDEIEINNWVMIAVSCFYYLVFNTLLSILPG